MGVLYSQDFVICAAPHPEVRRCFLDKSPLAESVELPAGEGNHEGLGLPPELGASAVRLSAGKLSTEEQMDRVAQLFPGVVQSARAMGGRF